MEHPRVRFGSSLQGASNEALRTRVMSLWPAEESTLVVDSVLALDDELTRSARLQYDAYDYLIFDIDHLFIYQRASGTTSPGLESLVRYVVDDYSRQPHHVLRAHARTNPFCFFYPIDSLDVLLSLWEHRRPNHVIDLNCRTAEIRTIRLQPHPQDIQDAHTCRPPAEDEPPPIELAAGSTLRRRPAAALGDCFCGTAGVIREQRTGWSALSLPTASAVVAWKNGAQRETCSGRGLRSCDAEAVASLEALERLHVGVRSAAKEVI